MNSMRQLLAAGEIRLLSNAVAAGVDGALVTTATEIDMLGFDSVAIVYSLGAIAANGLITTAVKNSATTATYGAGTIDKIGASLANSADTDDDKFIVHQIHRPSRRFLRTEYQRTVGNVAINGIFAILFNAGANPPANAQVEASQALVTPTPSAT
jgi:hypothetical protein